MRSGAVGIGILGDDEWDIQTGNFRVLQTVKSRLKGSSAVLRTLEVLVELERRGQLVGIDLGIEMTVTKDALDYLRAEWPAELDLPEMERRNTDDEDTGVHTMPDPPSGRRE